MIAQESRTFFFHTIAQVSYSSKQSEIKDY